MLLILRIIPAFAVQALLFRAGGLFTEIDRDWEIGFSMKIVEYMRRQKLTAHQDYL